MEILAAVTQLLGRPNKLKVIEIKNSRNYTKFKLQNAVNILNKADIFKNIYNKFNSIKIK